MKKTILLKNIKCFLYPLGIIGMMLLFIPMVLSEFSEDQIFTQEQIDEYDVTTLTRDDIQLTLVNFTITNRYSIGVYYNYLELMPFEAGTYKAVLMKNKRVTWNAAEMGKMCDTEMGISKLAYLDCFLNEYIPSKNEKFLNYIKYDIYYYKTGVRSYIVNLLNSWIG